MHAAPQNVHHVISLKPF